MTGMPQRGDRLECVGRFSQADYDEFARISGDDNPIHVDPEFAARTRFGRTVAHGMFLFGVLSAAAARWLQRPVFVLEQQLVFTAPTFAGEDVDICLEITSGDGSSVQIAQSIGRADGEQLLVGEARLGRHPDGGDADIPPSAESAGTFKGLAVGMTTSRERTFSRDDIDAYRRLFDDPNPLLEESEAIVPAALLGGTVSCVLGVDLPGPGTNWLKQHYWFERPVPVDRSTNTEVEIVRLRADKQLVDLVNRITAGGEPAVVGRSLVLVADVATRRGSQ